MTKNGILCASLVLLITTVVTAQAQTTAEDWGTPAEKSNFRKTPNYNETMAYLKRLEAASPWIRVTSFGNSASGHELPLVIASKEQAFSPRAAANSGKAIVLIQNAIHAGEMDGKDSSLMLLRDIAITKARAALLDHVILLVLPVYNVEGYERFGPYLRINQNGPEETGWRVNARNLNLNRDYMKADAPETRAFLKLVSDWLPDFFVDCHVTDGADYQYDVTYLLEDGPGVYLPLARWLRDSFGPRLEASVSRTGHRIAPLVWPRDNNDLAQGLLLPPSLPRFATGYMSLRNRATMLIEMHMLKDYRTRVLGNYEALRATLEIINADAEELRSIVRAADEATMAAGKTYRADAKFPLRFENTHQAEEIAFAGYRYRRELSEVSGATRIIYSHEPAELHLARYAEVAPVKTVAPPLAYIVPAQWSEVIAILAAHGLRLERLTEAVPIPIESYRFTEVKWQEKPYEGRHPVTVRTELVRETRRFPAGSVIVPLDQRAAEVAIHLLEPEAPDSFVAWGFFDAVFEQKESAESYVMERVAREMMERDPKLKGEFLAKVAADPKFAADPDARLDFFYRRSPYWDSQINLYPVGRLVEALRLPSEPWPRPH